VINAVISVPVMVAVMIAASSPKVMGRIVLPRKWKLLGWLATAAMAAASLALLVVSVG
jgi:Mn2+/Fe2+ NRAMP family transporter